MSKHPYDELDTDEALKALVENAHRFELYYVPAAPYALDGMYRAERQHRKGARLTGMYRAERQHRKGARLTVGDGATIREAVLNCYVAVAKKGQFA